MPEREPAYRVIGKRTPLVDGRGKVTGEAVYTDDIRLPDMLVGKILRSTQAHAKIRSIDLSAAAALPGVRAVIAGDESAVCFGVLPISRDETAMARGKVRYVGDCVAAVAADTEEAALAAVAAIRVDYEPLQSFLRPEQSLAAAEGDLKIHEHTRGNNVQKGVDQEFGDVDAALREALCVKTVECRFAGVTHAFTEPHCVIAHYNTEGRLTVWSATQVPHYLHRDLARVLEMPMHRIRVVRPYVGGAFGGKSDPFPHEMIAALLSRRTRRPVKILFDREEVALTNHGRHPTKNKVTLAVGPDRKLSALDVQALIDGGAWGSFGVVTTYYNGILSQGPYQVPAFRYSGRRVYSNKPPCGAMRGHGAVNTRFSIETCLDEVCEELGEDPIAFRIANALPANCNTPFHKFRITSNGLVQCLEAVRERSGWKDRFRSMPYGRGLGVAAGFYISGSALPINRTRLPHSTVHLKVDLDGGVTLHNLAAEIGQGSDTMLAQCAAEVLGLPLSRIRVRARDTDTAPIDLGSYSSRVTFMAGNAAARAAEQVLRQLCDAAERLTGKPAQGWVVGGEERLVYAPEPGMTLSYEQALDEALADRGALVGKGHYQAPELPQGDFKGGGAGLSPSYSFSAFVVDLSVDPDTGQVSLHKIWAAHDCGFPLNPIAVEGQVEGSIHMGLGQALCEDFAYNKASVVNANLLDYRTLSPKQMCPVEVILPVTRDPEGPYGGKECGEGPLLPILPAVANAIYDAVGVRMHQLPMTPDRIWQALERRRREAARPAVVGVGKE